MSPVIGLQIGLVKENLVQSEVQIIDNHIGLKAQPTLMVNNQELNEKMTESSRKSPTPLEQQSHPRPNSSTSRLTMTVNMDQKANKVNSNESSNSITQEMQLRAAYELQVWKEQKEKEFEQHV